jgi:Fe-S cluster biogenesis protein NfuA
MDGNYFQKSTERIEQLIQRVTALKDEQARAAALDLLQSLMDFHSAALSRVIDVLSGSQEGRSALAKLNEDPLICGLLVLYGIHPLTLPQRVDRAVEKAGEQLRKQNATVDLVRVTETSVQVKVQRSKHGCFLSPQKLRFIVEHAIREIAPEIVDIIVDGIPNSDSAFIPVEMIQSRSETPV